MSNSVQTSDIVNLTLTAFSDKFDLSKVRIADIALTIGLRHIREHGITLTARPVNIPTVKDHAVKSPLDSVVDDIN